MKVSFPNKDYLEIFMQKSELKNGVKVGGLTLWFAVHDCGLLV